MLRHALIRTTGIRNVARLVRYFVRRREQRNNRDKDRLIAIFLRHPRATGNGRARLRTGRIACRFSPFGRSIEILADYRCAFASGRATGNCCETAIRWRRDCPLSRFQFAIDSESFARRELKRWLDVPYIIRRAGHVSQPTMPRSGALGLLLATALRDQTNSPQPSTKNGRQPFFDGTEGSHREHVAAIEPKKCSRQPTAAVALKIAAEVYRFERKKELDRRRYSPFFVAPGSRHRYPILGGGGDDCCEDARVCRARARFRRAGHSSLRHHGRQQISVEEGKMRRCRGNRFGSRPRGRISKYRRSLPSASSI